MPTYTFLPGPTNQEFRGHLDQMLLSWRSSPRLSFGRPLPGATWFSASAPCASAADLHRHEKFKISPRSRISLLFFVERQRTIAAKRLGTPVLRVPESRTHRTRPLRPPVG